MPLQQIVPTWLVLNAANDQSASYFTDLRTGQPINAGGLNLGDYFDLTEGEANALSYPAIGTLHEGRYRRVLVDSGATASNIKTGTIGLLKSLKLGVNVITSYDQGLATSLRPVVFLNVVTPGNYCFVQEQGYATVLTKSSLTNGSPAIGDIINSATSGLADDPTTQTQGPTYIGVALALPAASALLPILFDPPVVQG